MTNNNITSTPSANSQQPHALDTGYKACLTCHAMLPIETTECPVCYHDTPARIPNSLNKTLAYLITAIICFIPANILPIMRTTTLGNSEDSTILSGILLLWREGAYAIALIILVASFITPLFKIISISYLCYSCHRQSSQHQLFRTKLYHFNEMIGRWSMIDVFVVALLGALVKIGAFATIEPRLGVVAFALVVFFTIFSLHYFDPRLIWDNPESSKHSKQ